MSASNTSPELQYPIVISPEGKTLEVSDKFVKALEEFQKLSVSGELHLFFRSGRMIEVKGIRSY